MIAYMLSLNMRDYTVIDTNVFVQAMLGPKGYAREVMRLCLEETIYPIMGTALYTEYESLLNRDHLFKTCLLTKEEREALLNGFMSVCRWVNIYYLWRPNLNDEADNHVLELAVSGNAKSIVTSNYKDFKHCELSFPQIEIVRPKDFARRFLCQH